MCDNRNVNITGELNSESEGLGRRLLSRRLFDFIINIIIKTHRGQFIVIK